MSWAEASRWGQAECSVRPAGAPSWQGAGTDPETGNWIPQVSESDLTALSFCR